MVDSVNNISNVIQGSNGTPATEAASTKDIGKDAFLKLLIAQLKNQDPLEPKDQGEFATDLAQFSQVEQLTEINKALQNSGGNSGLGLASYLGHEVILNSQTVEVSGGNGGMLNVDLPTAVSSLKVDLLDENENIVASKTFSDLEEGRQNIELDEINAPAGSYSYKVSATNSSGTPVTVDARIAGIVSGFIPGENQTLLIGDREISLADIAEVRVAK